MRWLLLSTLLVQSATAQSEADKLEAALTKFGDRNYRVKFGNKESGNMSLRTRIEKEGDRNIVVFEDRFAANLKGQELVLTATEKASLDRLRLISTKRITKDNGKEVQWTVSVEGKKATLQSPDQKQTIEVSERTIGEQAVVRGICAAEQKEGVTFTADVMSGIEDQLQRDHTFRCLGKELLEIGGKKVGAFKWQHKGEWTVPRKVDDEDVAVTTEVDNVYWISPDGYLLRQTSNGGRTEIILDVK